MNTNNTSNEAAIVPCQILGLLPFDFHHTSQIHPDFATSHVAAALMAVDHFNNRDPVVVPELRNLTTAGFLGPLGGDEGDVVSVAEGCPVILSEPKFINFHSDRSMSKYLMTLSSSSVCAMVGPYQGIDVAAVSIISQGLDVPIISHGSNDVELTRREFYPTLAAMSANRHSTAKLAVNYMLKHGRTDFLATIAMVGYPSDEVRKVIDDAAVHANMTRRDQYAIGRSRGPEFGVPEVLERIKESGYRNIFVQVNNLNNLQRIADYAEYYNLNNGDYFWMLHGEYWFYDQITDRANENVNMSKLVDGMMTSWYLDGFHVPPAFPDNNNGDDPFLTQWKAQNMTMVDRINSHNPFRDDPEALGYYEAPDNYFRSMLPHRGASYIYDSVMSVALGKCKELADSAAKASTNKGMKGGGGNGGGGNGGGGGGGSNGSNAGRNRNLMQQKIRGQTNRPKQREANTIKTTSATAPRRKLQKGSRAPKAIPHLQGMFDTTFHGATGEVTFAGNEEGGYRELSSLTYGVYNFRSKWDYESNSATSNFYLTEVLMGHPEHGEFVSTSNGPFIFSTGRSTPPQYNRDPPDHNYLAKSAQATGIAFMALALVLIAGSFLFVLFNQKKAVVRHSQPIFLYMLLAGSAVMICAIFTLSFDESYGWSEDMLSIACSATPWLLSLGYNGIYLALFCKLRRIDIVMDMSRRRSVRPSHVMAPFGIAMLATVALLISWTVVDPLTWRREVIDVLSGETYGQCESENGNRFYVPIVVLMALITVACGYMAFKCRDIDKRFSESVWIYYTFFVQFQVLLIGTPVLISLEDSSAEASYLGKSMLIFAIAVTAVVLMIGPKALALYKPNPAAANSASLSDGSSNRRAPQQRFAATGNVHVTGLQAASPSPIPANPTPDKSATNNTSSNPRKGTTVVEDETQQQEDEVSSSTDYTTSATGTTTSASLRVPRSTITSNASATIESCVTIDA